MNDETLHEEIEIEEEAPLRSAGSTVLVLQVPVKLPMEIRQFAEFASATEKQLKGAFGTKMSNLVMRHAVGENPCFQFTLEIPKQRIRKRAPRNRVPTGRGPGRPRKPAEGESTEE